MTSIDFLSPSVELALILNRLASSNANATREFEASIAIKAPFQSLEVILWGI